MELVKTKKIPRNVKNRLKSRVLYWKLKKEVRTPKIDSYKVKKEKVRKLVRESLNLTNSTNNRFLEFKILREYGRFIESREEYSLIDEFNTLPLNSEIRLVVLGGLSRSTKLMIRGKAIENIQKSNKEEIKRLGENSKYIVRYLNMKKDWIPITKLILGIAVLDKIGDALLAHNNLEAAQFVGLLIMIESIIGLIKAIKIRVFEEDIKNSIKNAIEKYNSQ